MPNIDEYTQKISSAVLGEEVRGSIRSAIEAMNTAVNDGISSAAAMVSTPLTAATVAAMTDTTKVYVYTGNETGYDTGHWYYYDGTEWVRGGAYHSPKYDYDDLYNKPKIIEISSDEPEDSRTNVWFDPDGEEVEVPTMEEFESIIADEYDSAKTYSVGDFCLYNVVLYECTTAIVTAEAWNPTHWTLTNVGRQIGAVKEDLNLLIGGQYEYKFEWKSGDIDSSGQEITDSVYVRTDFISADLLRGKSFFLNGSYILYVYYYNPDYSFYGRISSNADGSFDLTGTVAFVRLVTRAEYKGLLTVNGMVFETKWKEDIDNLISETEKIESDIVEIKKVVDASKNYTEGYYLSETGELVENSDYCVTEKINITSITSGVLFWYGENNSYYIRLVSFDVNDNVIDYWGGSSSSEYRSIPNFGTGASYVRFSFNKGYDAKLTSSISGGTYHTYWETGTTGGLAKHVDMNRLQSSIVGNEGLSNYAQSLVNGVSLTINSDISIKKNKVYHLHALIDSNFDSVYFGHGESTYSLYFKIDRTNITFMTNGSEGSQLEHGLTLDTYIDFVLIVGEKNTGTIIFNTLGGVYTKTVQTVNGYKGNVFVRPSGCTLTEVFIGFSCSDFRQPIWMFGDSYFTHTSDARWTYWLIEWGFGRCLMNAFAGENSSEALPQALSYLANNGTPKYIVWCLGMNDPDNGAVNSSWLSCVKALIAQCEKSGVEPILATIPNVPNYNNTYKNAWVKASGYRYIDFAKSVGAESAGSRWYTGCLSSDNTHPTELGARLLCSQALQDVSELTLGNI